MSDLPDIEGGYLTVSIYESNYNWLEIPTNSIADGENAWLGYYNETTGYEPLGTNWIYGLVNETDDAIADKIYDPLGAKAWPSDGEAILNLPPNYDDSGYFTLNLIDEGSEYYFTRNDTFIVLTRLNGFPDGGDLTQYRMGFCSGSGHIEPQPCLKFYNTISSPDGRLDNNDWGWYIRSYIWDWRCNVEWTGDRGPLIKNITEVGTSFYEGQWTIYATITDDDPSGITAGGVANATLYYCIDHGDFFGVPMTNTTGNEFSAVIPEQFPNHSIRIYYYINAIDLQGLKTNSHQICFTVGTHYRTEVLLLMNGPDATDNLTDLYKMTGGMDFKLDVWAYGPATKEMLDCYKYIIEISTTGPLYDNIPVVQDWLNGGNRYYALLGDEVLGYHYGWPDSAVNIPVNDPPDSTDNFFSYLGIKSYYSGLSSATDTLIEITGVVGDIISGELVDSTDNLVVDPYYWLNIENKIDGVTITDDARSCFTVIPQVDYYGTDPITVGFYREDHDLNNKLAFLAFDPISLIEYFADDSCISWGNTPIGPLTKLLKWFQLPLQVTDNPATLPDAFNLMQNYPNPFNPTTTISFELPKRAFTTLRIYNLKGQLVEALVNRSLPAGSHQIYWNPGELPSGMYFYRIESDNVRLTRKCLILK